MTLLLFVVCVALVGLLIRAFGAIGELRRRVLRLEQSTAQRAASVPLSATPPASTPVGHGQRAPPNTAAEQIEAPDVSPAIQTAPARAAHTTADVAQALPPPLPHATPVLAAAPAARAPSMAGAPAPPSPPNWLDRALATLKHWFTEGNVPVKVGMLVLFAGVAALLKYASDQGWLRLPIEFRLAGIALAALAGLVFGWRKRRDNRAFALSLQGGMIGILLLVIFAAFKSYGLLGAAPAFGLSVVLIAGAGVLAVLQDSRALAVFALLAGFLAPIWLSTGTGNHVALFSYYAILDTAIFAIAWFKSWRVLNLLGFAFTFGIGTLWGVFDYRPEKFASTEPFLLLFFAVYLLIPLLDARRQTPQRRGVIDGSLLFGTPLVAFCLQAALLEGERMPLALCALGLAAIYAALGFALRRRANVSVLTQAYALLAVGFATLAVPLALSARVTASAFALEGAGLVWLGLRQRRRLPQWAGLGLQLAAAAALGIGLLDWNGAPHAVANPRFMGAVLIALAGFASAWAYRRNEKQPLAVVCYVWGLLWWCGNLLVEIQSFVDWPVCIDGWLIALAVTGWIAAELHRRTSALALALTALGAFVVAFPLAWLQTASRGDPFSDGGWLAWIVFAACGIRSLQCLRGGGITIARIAQFAWWLLWPMLFSFAAWKIADRFALADGWTAALCVLPWLIVAAIAVLRWHWLTAPLGAAFDGCRTALQTCCFGVIAAWWLLVLWLPDPAAPLSWMPVLNPVELVQLACVALLARWLWSDSAPRFLVDLRLPLLAIAAFAYVTSATLHCVHHWGGVPWRSVVASGLGQTSLSVVWSVLGVLGWIVGSRRGQWMVWVAGAMLMAVVLLKLMLVDRHNLGNLLGIGAFIAYGLLCTLVGWLAPAPPRSPTAQQEVAA